MAVECSSNGSGDVPGEEAYWMVQKPVLSTHIVETNSEINYAKFAPCSCLMQLLYICPSSSAPPAKLYDIIVPEAPVKYCTQHAGALSHEKNM